MVQRRSVTSRRNGLQFLRSLWRPWCASLLVLGIAAAVRLPHYDVAWFGLDQIYFMAEARRVLSGQWDVVGPLASGLNIVGPLYSYLLAGLLWLRDDPRFLVLFGVTCDVAATWFVYDTARRLTAPSLGIVAALTYVTVPTLVLGTRLIWNPSLLPAVVAIGWWLAVRYCHNPSTLKLVSVAFAAGLTLPLHATGIFHAAGLMVAVLIAKPPSFGQILAALVAGALPLLPLLPRLVGATSDAGSLGDRFAVPVELVPALKSFAQMTLGFPRAFGEHWSAGLSTAAALVQALVAGIGLVLGLTQRSPYRPIWLGLTVSLVSLCAAALFYAGPISWHYFIALAATLCLCIARAIGGLPTWRIGAAAAMAGIAVAHLPFLERFDRQAIASGLIRVEAGRVGFRVPQTTAYAPVLRDLRAIGRAVQSVIPDGATAMLGAHGGRGELWRETGAEFMPPAAAPLDGWRAEFLLMGPGATPLRPKARLIDKRVCAFERSRIRWKALHGAPPIGWELPQFADSDWMTIGLPQRMRGPSLAGPGSALVGWRSPQLLLRGRFDAATTAGRHALGVLVRSLGYSEHWIARASINGTALASPKDRVFLSTVSMSHEWFIDLTGRLQAGENVIALALDGQIPAFDLDVFDVPCLDSEWYH